MGDNMKISIDMNDFLNLMETDIRQKVLLDFLEKNFFFNREVILCILGITDEGMKNEG